MSDGGQDGSEARSPLAQAWDIARYAPIGLLFDGPSFLPKLAELGKEHVSNARAVGEMAVRRATEQLRVRFDLDGSGDLDSSDGSIPEAAEPRAPRPERQRPVPDPSAPTAEELAIEDYESLAAPQVVSRLPGLSPEELEAVRRFEAAHRGRKTILNRAAQLGAAG